MAQLQFPIFPEGATTINIHLAFLKKDAQITYFYGHLPIFNHDIDDLRSFRMITSQFYVNGSATQAEISRAFGVTKISVKRAVKVYREKGIPGFFEEPNTRGPAVLTESVLTEAQDLLDKGYTASEVSEKLGINGSTLRKAISSGRLHRSKKN